MTQPLFFEPDPGIPDSDLLGYGDLIYDDGTREFINGDPEISSMFRAPDAYQPDPGLMEPVDLGQDEPLGMELPESTIQPIGDTGATVDISTGEIDVGGESLGEPAPARIGTTSVEYVGREQPIPGTDATVDISTGEVNVGAGLPEQSAGYGTGGLQLAQREGALPPQLANQQALEREQQNAAQYQALEQGRKQELAIYRQANAQRMGQLQAEEQVLRKQQQEQQFKLQRWQDEQQLTSDLDIKTDLVSAVGVTGTIFALLGGVLSGMGGSDFTSRMVDSVIDQNVRKQINMRDTKLRVLADRVGSTEQAIAAGKAQLYKIAAEKVEMAQKLTQADIFEAQTPQLLQDLRAKQQAFEQQQEQISLGKTIEKAPVVGKPSAGAMRAQQMYGKAAAEQEATENEIIRAAKQLGLEGWNAETGRFENRDAVLKEGLHGVGRLDTFAKTLGKLPFVGALPEALDQAGTSDRGLANRAALESLANAEAARINPGKAPSDADRLSAKQSLGTLSEAGAVEAIERLMKWQETQRAQNLSIYGTEAAAPYEQRRDATGVPRAQVGPGGDTGEAVQAGSAREALQREFAGQRRGSTEVVARAGERAPAQAESPEQRLAELSDYVVSIAGRELPPEGVEILMAQAGHETRDGEAAPGNNFFGHKANKAGRSSGEQALMTTEGEGAGARRTRERFAMFDTVADSVADHVDLLKLRYPEAWGALMEGDPARYVAALKDGGYFTGNETTYLNQILARLGARQTELDQSMESGL
jgi:flagellum-specific peptidoglycan hydrolase FlgJ